MDTERIVRRFRDAPSNATSLRNERKAVSKMVSTESRAEVLALAHRLIKVRIPRFVACELVLNHKITMQTLTTDEVQKLGDGISHWGISIRLLVSFRALLGEPVGSTTG